MNTFGALLTLLLVLMQLSLPRRWALVPLLLTFALMTRTPIVDLGGATFTAHRVVVGVGCLRALMRNERPSDRHNAVDLWMLAWAFWLLATAAFHVDGSFVLRAGTVWDYLGAYFLCRVFLSSTDDVLRTLKVLCYAMVPVAALMLVEKFTGHNAFAILGGVPELAAVRGDGQIRASGPYAHAVLAGTVGASLLAFAWCLRTTNKSASLLGLAAGLTMVFTCSSSGPLLMVVGTVCAALLWRVRDHLTFIRWLVLAGIGALALVMKDPVYFLIAKLDVVGGSTGWYRAQLIRSSLEHIDEWWLIGTDYTRHWMYTGNPANPDSSDITNQYLANGVLGGLPLMMIFIMLILSAFHRVGRTVKLASTMPAADQSLSWMMGACLFGHSMNFFSMTFWDHSAMSFYIPLAALGAIGMATQARADALQQASPAERHLERERNVRGLTTST